MIGVTMEDSPSTGSSSSRILQRNNFARTTESDAERLSAIAIDHRFSDALACCFMGEAPGTNLC
jgi:hypothetical protein